MDNVVTFPNQKLSADPLKGLRAKIEQRYGVTMEEYIGSGGKRSEEVQSKIDHAMRKETLIMATNLINN
ncbi:hypothetical protein [Paenibacillus macerans]|uniref:hypothetical protein n=1 Tax=Paenibacillus macerans TaxID=44252 RepID=UPI003D315669